MMSRHARRTADRRTAHGRGADVRGSSDLKLSDVRAGERDVRRASRTKRPHGPTTKFLLPEELRGRLKTARQFVTSPRGSAEAVRHPQKDRKAVLTDRRARKEARAAEAVVLRAARAAAHEARITRKKEARR